MTHHPITPTAFFQETLVNFSTGATTVKATSVTHKVILPHFKPKTMGTLATQVTRTTILFWRE